jgi:hypothetical protein
MENNIHSLRSLLFIANMDISIIYALVASKSLVSHWLDLLISEILLWLTSLRNGYPLYEHEKMVPICIICMLIWSPYVYVNEPSRGRSRNCKDWVACTSGTNELFTANKKLFRCIHLILIYFLNIFILLFRINNSLSLIHIIVYECPLYTWNNIYWKKQMSWFVFVHYVLFLYITPSDRK